MLIMNTEPVLKTVLPTHPYFPHLQITDFKMLAALLPLFLYFRTFTSHYGILAKRREGEIMPNSLNM